MAKDNGTDPFPKVVVVGAGSLFFGRQEIWQMVHSPHLQNGTLALVDTDAQRLEQLVTMAKMVKNAQGRGLEHRSLYSMAGFPPRGRFRSA